jgi:hypothetical protein
MMMGPTCEGMHALHAMMAYEILEGSAEKIREIVRFIFQKSEEVLANRHSADAPDIHFTAHLLTPLTELPPDYALTPEERHIFTQIINILALDLEKAAKSELDGRVNDTSHAIDVLSHLPAQLSAAR